MVPRGVTFTETESRTRVAGAGRVGKREFVFHVDRIPILQMEGGDGCTRMQMHLLQLN